MIPLRASHGSIEGMGRFFSIFGKRAIQRLGGLAMGMIIALLTLLYQLRHGVILHAYERGAWFSVVWPYSFAILGTLAWEALMTWLILRKRDAAIGEGEAALFRHYSTCSRKLALSLETVRHHWEDAGVHLVHPLGNNCDAGRVESELEAFKTIYRNHLEWLAFEIPEFDSSVLPTYPSNAEYLDVLRALRLHGKHLDDGANLIGLKANEEETHSRSEDQGFGLPQTSSRKR